MMHLPELNRTSLDKYIRSVGIRQIRLACGLVLFAYLLSHFANHALGNISLDALATGVRYHTAFWKSLPISTAFYAAAATHAGFGIYALYQRRQFHWKAIERIQLVLGLSIPALIVTHLAGVRLDDVLFQHQNFIRKCFTHIGWHGHTRCG
jgi:adenylate cyclase